MANSLRLAGRLAQASSYFRIAYEKEPRNAELLYEMSRFFRSSAQTDDARLIQRSDACLRLASRLAHEAPDLLERIGEAFYERLDYKRATECFRRAIALDPNRFRANVGLAEIALKDGKLAHVARYYNAAAATRDVTLARMAEREARYYERLAGDEDFLEKELDRIRLLTQPRGGGDVFLVVAGCGDCRQVLLAGRAIRLGADGDDRSSVGRGRPRHAPFPPRRLRSPSCLRRNAFLRVNNRHCHPKSGPVIVEDRTFKLERAAELKYSALNYRKT
jgi:tetratricopeptide (TPR) repeat protein